MSLTQAVAALRASEKGFSNISSNLATQTVVGGKRIETEFKTIVAAGSSGGVQAVSMRGAAEQGAMRATEQDTDLAIAGNGFFVVGKYGEVPAQGSNEFSFTRAGSFKTDKQGYLKNSSDYYLQGWPTDTNGVPTVSDLNSLSGLRTIRMNQIAGITTPTTNASLKINLPATLPNTESVNSSMEVYNSLGESNSLQFQWTKVSTFPTLTWNLTITTSSGAPVTQNNAAGAPYANIPVVFNGSGQPVSWGGSTAGTPNVYIDWSASSAANASAIALNLGTTASSDGISCRAEGYSETLVEQDGKGPGQVNGIEINKDGIVSALFNNGQSLKIFKIPLANFASPHMLELKEGDSWGQTDSSGGFLLASAKSAGMGSIESKSLEQSTVEIAAELTKMMELERFYSSNTKVIQADDNMFSDLKQLFR